MAVRFGRGVMATVLQAGCVLAAAMATGAPAQAAEPMTLDVVLPLTGPGSFLGLSEQLALQLQQKLVNETGGIHGHPVNFVYHDDQSSPQVGVQMLVDAKQKNPSVILGSTLVGICNAMAPIVKNGPPLYCFSAGVHPPAGSMMFTGGASTTDDARALLAYFRGRGWNDIALMTSNDATGQEADQSFAELLTLPENKGMHMVSNVHFDIKDVSVNAQLERVQAANPQAFIGWTTGSALGTILRGMAQAGYKVPFGTTPGNNTYAQMHQFAAFLPAELYSGISAWPVGGDPNSKLVLPPGMAQKVKELYASFAAVGKQPDEGNLIAWDPATMVIDSLRALPDGATAAQLHEYLINLQNAPGASGMYDFKSFPQRGLGPKDVIVVRWNAARDAWDVVGNFGGDPL